MDRREDHGMDHSCTCYSSGWCCILHNTILARMKEPVEQNTTPDPSECLVNAGLVSLVRSAYVKKLTRVDRHSINGVFDEFYQEML